HVKHISVTGRADARGIDDGAEQRDLQLLERRDHALDVVRSHRSDEGDRLIGCSGHRLGRRAFRIAGVIARDEPHAGPEDAALRVDVIEVEASPRSVLAGDERTGTRVGRYMHDDEIAGSRERDGAKQQHGCEQPFHPRVDPGQSSRAVHDGCRSVRCIRTAMTLHRWAAAGRANSVRNDRRRSRISDWVRDAGALLAMCAFCWRSSPGLALYRWNCVNAESMKNLSFCGLHGASTYRKIFAWLMSSMT